MVTLNEETKHLIDEAYWRFLNLKTPNRHVMAMGEREAFIGVVRQMLREMMSDERRAEKAE
jgi:hypothetical protein